MHACIHTYIHTHTHTHTGGPGRVWHDQNPSRRTYIHAYTFTYIHTHTHTQADLDAFRMTKILPAIAAKEALEAPTIRWKHDMHGSYTAWMSVSVKGAKEEPKIHDDDVQDDE